MVAKGNVNKHSKQIKLRFKNLPQAEALKRSADYNQNVSHFSKMFQERKKTILENISLKINKKNISANTIFLKNLKFNSDLSVLNLVNVSTFSKNILVDYIKDICGKHDIKIKLNVNQDLKKYVTEIYSSKKISLQERISLKFLLNFEQKSNTLSSLYKEYRQLSDFQLTTNLSQIQKDLNKREIRDLKASKTNERNSSSDAKDAREAEANITEHYSRLFEDKKKIYNENQKKIENLTLEIFKLLPEVVASADLIEFIKLKEFKQNYAFKK